jgi:hypothetical protein
MNPYNHPYFPQYPPLPPIAANRRLETNITTEAAPMNINDLLVAYTLTVLLLLAFVFIVVSVYAIGYRFGLRDGLCGRERFNSPKAANGSSVTNRL